MQTSKIVVIAGPTASGKSELALNIAEQTDGVVINADSMQVYKDIPILAATPSKEDLARAPHKLYGIYEASYKGNVVDWLKLCEQEITNARNSNKTPVIVGGTGLYIESLTKGVTPIPETKEDVRKQVDEMLKTKGLETLYEYLRQIDIDAYNRLSPNDTTRIKRAIEIYLDTSQNLTYWHSLPLKKLYNENEFTLVYIKPSREELDMRSRLRFDIMMQKGALDEVKTLLAKNLPDDLPCMRALGVQDLKLYLENICSLEEAIELAKLHTRQYAKRQTTWFNNRYKEDFCLKACYNNDKIFVEDIKKAL
jgi:tRNA dimethylallyltransferase